jgi:hypothetical protein
MGVKREIFTREAEHFLMGSSFTFFHSYTLTGGLKAEKDKKNTPSPNLLFFQNK